MKSRRDDKIPADGKVGSSVKANENIFGMVNELSPRKMNAY
jgi:hypothetical protein